MKDMSKGASTTYSPSRIPIKCEIAFNMSKWTIENINDKGALGKVSKMDVFIEPMKYMSGAFKYFCLHVEDGHFASVSYLEERAAKV